MASRRLGVLISGRGSNLRALADAVHQGRLDARIGIVISNSADAAGLAIAKEFGIETLVMSHRAHATRDSFDVALVEALKARDIEFVCLAGFMRILGSRFCQGFPEGVLNIHPSLLPAFPGANAQQQALEYGVRVTGATVHFVTPELDAGPIVLQESVPVLDDDTIETLSTRILSVEHRIYPEAVQRLLSNSWRIEARRVVFR